MFCIIGNLTSELVTWQPEAICICNLCLNSLYTTIVEMAWRVKNFRSEINRIVSCIVPVWSGHPRLLVSSHLTSSLPQLFFSVYSFIAIHCLFLLLVSHSSFLICSSPSGSCSLIYFYHAAWKESRQEQKRNQQPFLSSQSPLWILLVSECLVFLHL